MKRFLKADTYSYSAPVDGNKKVILQKDDQGLDIAVDTHGNAISQNGFLQLIDGTWVKEDDLEPVGAIPQVDVFKMDIFVVFCCEIARSINDNYTNKWLVYSEYIFARGLIETGLNTQALPVGRVGTGPLAITPTEWAKVLTTPMAVDAGLTAGDIAAPSQSAYGAMQRMLDDAATISAALTVSDNASGPYLPTMGDLLLSQVCGDVQVAIAISKGADGDKLSTVPLAAPAVLARLETYPPLAAALGGSVAVFRAVFDAMANAALAQAHALVVQYASWTLPLIRTADAPWMDVAKTENDKQGADKVLQGTVAGNISIINYFKATDPQYAGGVQPWCGAFVAYCMSQCGGRIAEAVPGEAARAASWQTWGTTGISPQSNNIPFGAVVLIGSSTGIGHVTLFTQKTADGLFACLGGNQGVHHGVHEVNISNFAPSDVVAIRWDDASVNVPTSAAAGGADIPGPAPAGLALISDAAFQKIVEFEVSDKAYYNSNYVHPDWPGGSSGVTIGIGYDVGACERAEFIADWQPHLDPRDFARLLVTSGKTGLQAKALAKSLADISVSFDLAMTVHRTCVVPRETTRVIGKLPKAAGLNGDCLGALVSLSFNRGATFRTPGDRYSQMRDIAAAIDDGSRAQLQTIPGSIRAMKMLWPDSSGLRDRRDAEAALFQSGLDNGQPALH